MTYRGVSSARPRAVGRASLTAIVTAVGAAALAANGCYNPSVVNGKLLCGPSNACPDGFSCLADGHCWRGGVMDVDSGSTDDGSTFDMGGCVPQKMNCTPTVTSGCDPVCQTGCLCHEKCTINTSGVAACVPVAGQAEPLEGCTIQNFGAANQSDNCVAGSVCLRPDPTFPMNWCFAHCASDADCPGARCVTRPLGAWTAMNAPVLAKVCDVPFVPCNPFNNAGCTDPRRYCYVTTHDSSTGFDTVCDFTSGLKNVNESCTSYRDCFTNLVCPLSDGTTKPPGAGFCAPLCDSTAHPCTTVGSCHSFSTDYGYCN